MERPRPTIGLLNRAHEKSYDRSSSLKGLLPDSYQHECAERKDELPAAVPVWTRYMAEGRFENTDTVETIESDLAPSFLSQSVAEASELRAGCRYVDCPAWSGLEVCTSITGPNGIG
jgi:hypothetical protein